MDGKRLKELRERKGLTQEQLSRATGIALGTIGRLESTKAEIKKVDMLSTFLRFFDDPDQADRNSGPDRLERLTGYLNISLNKLSEEIGMKSSQALYDVKDGKIKAVSLDLAKRICDRYPAINRNWLAFGEGDMIKLPRIEEEEEEDTPKANLVKNEWPKGALDANSSPEHAVPLYDMDIDAGSVTRLFDQNSSTPIVGWIYLKDTPNTTGLIGVRARGDSMSTFISGGDSMLIRKLDNYDFVPPGHAYVIISEHLAVVKYIRKGKDNDHWCLRSHNVDYEDFEVKKTDVKHLFIVVKVLKELSY